MKFQADDSFQSAALMKIAHLRRSFPCLKMRLIVPKHKKVYMSGCRIKISDELGTLAFLFKRIPFTLGLSIWLDFIVNKT